MAFQHFNQVNFSNLWVKKGCMRNNVKAVENTAQKESKTQNQDLLESEEKSWLDEIISEQDKDLIEEDTLMDKIPSSIAEQYRENEF